VSDPVSHPSHYTDNPNGIELIDAIEHLPFTRGSAIKYIYRAGKKDPAKEVEDLKKALWLIQREITKLTK